MTVLRSEFLLPFSGKCWWMHAWTQYECVLAVSKMAHKGGSTSQKMWVHFAALLLLSGRSEKCFFSEIKPTLFNSFSSEEMDLESCVNFLSKLSKINWISGEKPDATWKDGEYRIGIVKHLSRCREIASTD